MQQQHTSTRSTTLSFQLASTPLRNYSSKGTQSNQTYKSRHLPDATHCEAGKECCCTATKTCSMPCQVRQAAHKHQQMTVTLSNTFSADCRRDQLTCLHPSSTVSQLPTMSTASWLSMNSQTPSLARIMNLSTGVSSFTVHSGSDVTPTLHASHAFSSTSWLMMSSHTWYRRTLDS